METTRVAIIGGGPGGLMTAFGLNRSVPNGLEITLFEASDRLGGKVRTARFDSDDVGYEAGAAELYDYSQLGDDPLLDMVRTFGLKTRPMDGTAVVLRGRQIKTTDDLSGLFGPATYRAVVDFGRRARAAISPAEYYESDWRADNQDPLARKAFQELLDAVPDQTARTYIRVATASDIATEPHATSAAYGLQNYLMNEPGYMRLYSIDGGIEKLTRELASRIRAVVKTNHRVTRVEKTAAGKYRVSAEHRRQTVSDDFDFVVTCLPNGWLPLVDWAGEKLRSAVLAHYRHYDHPAHYLRVSVLFKSPFWRDEISGSYFMLDSFGGCCVYDESARSDGVTHGVLGWLIGGQSAVMLGNLDDGELIRTMLDSLPPFLSHGRDLFIEGRVHRWIGSVNGLPGGFPAREPDSRHVPEPQDHPGLFFVGDYLFDSTLNGVLDSADTVAEWIAEELAD